MSGRVESTSYTAVHQKVVRQRGRASAHECAACGAQASDWAYTGGGGGGAMPHSADPRDYEPLCRSCHWAQDRGRFWCDRHQCWTERTKYRQRAGREVDHRVCRECNREHGRHRSALIKQARALLGLSSKEYVNRYGQGRRVAESIIEEHTA